MFYIPGAAAVECVTDRSIREVTVVSDVTKDLLNILYCIRFAINSIP